MMKPLWFLGDSRKALQEFPKDARREAGYQLELVQMGLPQWISSQCSPSGMALRSSA
jgi:phage-related protein